MSSNALTEHKDYLMLCHRNVNQNHISHFIQILHFVQDTQVVEYKKALPAKLKLFEDFIGEKSFPAGQKVNFCLCKISTNGI